jgi:hypothetical protein
MTKDQLRHSFKVYIDEVERCKRTGCYWSLLHMTLSLPDIFNTMEVDDKEPKTGPRYKAWCTNYLTRHDPAIDGEEWWDIRNNVLHQGYTLTKKTSRLKGFVFCPPGVNKHKQIDPTTNKMRLDVCLLAEEMLMAMDRWIEDLLKNPARLKQVEKYIPELVWEAPTGPSPQEIRTSVASSSMGSIPPGVIPFRNTTQTP